MTVDPAPLRRRPTCGEHAHGPASTRRSARLVVDVVVLIALIAALTIAGAPQHAAADVEPGSRVCMLSPSVPASPPLQASAPGDVLIANLTPVSATGPGHGALVSSDATATEVSHVNYLPGSVDPNLGAAIIGSDAQVCFLASQHSTLDLVVDFVTTLKADRVTVNGSPTRLVDTRIGIGGERLRASERRCFGVPGVPRDLAVINLTPLLARRPGFGLLVSSDVVGSPVGSNVNFAAGSIDPNWGLAPIGGDGKVCFQNSQHASVDLVADHLFNLHADAFQPAAPDHAPRRVVDTRIGLGGNRLDPMGHVCAGVTGQVGDLAIVNVTPVLASAPGFGGFDSYRQSSSVNFAPGSVDPNVAITRIGNDGNVCFYNSEHASVDVVVDHLGTISASAAAFNIESPRLLDTRESGTLTASHCTSVVDCIVATGSVGGINVLSQDVRGLHHRFVAGVFPTGGAIHGVACTESDWCVAVGGTNTVTPFMGRHSLVVESHDGGRRWGFVGGAADELRDVTCPTGAACVAVGYTAGPYEMPSGGTIVVFLNNGATTSHYLGDGTPRLHGIECSTEFTCVVSSGHVISTADGWQTSTVTAPSEI